MSHMKTLKNKKLKMESCRTENNIWFHELYLQFKLKGHEINNQML